MRMSFPRTPELEGAAAVTLDSDTLAEAISRTLFAAGSDDLKAGDERHFLRIAE